MTDTAKLVLGWIKCWWHCLLNFHRMCDAAEKPSGGKWRTTWIGCECGLTFYGTKPKEWWPNTPSPEER